MLCSVCPIQVVWRIDCPLDTHRSIDFLAEMCAPGRGRTGENTKGSALRLIWIFVSLCKSSLLIGGAFFRPPPVNPDFFLLFPPYAIVVFVHERPTRVCSSLSAHLSRWGEPRGERGSEKKTFGKLIAGKKRNDIAKKSVYNHHDGGESGREKRTWKKKSFYPVWTDDEYTNIFKREICRWNKLLERWALTTSAKRRKKTKKRCAGGSVRKSIDSGHGKKWLHMKECAGRVDWLINSLPCLGSVC